MIKRTRCCSGKILVLNHRPLVFGQLTTIADICRSTFRSVGWLVLVGCWLGSVSGVVAQAAQDNSPSPENAPSLVPDLAPASGEGEQALKQFQILPQLTGELFAAEPDVANIVAFYRDYQGRFFVCETFRQQKNEGVQDNRDHRYWLNDDLQAQTVQDRIDFIRKHIPNADQLYTARDDRIRLLQDRNGDGKADHSQVFADRFNQLEMGTGADVLAYRNKVFYTCIPDLYLLEDTTGDGVADQRQVLHSGYGVRFAFRGHDLHGLVIGPDRRLYFSIGDRGYNVSPDIKDPASGAVFRCELDGSQLEVYCTGLRNPQNLAFDDFGNLFTCDNNSDSGDQARWLYLVPGADYGWRMYYQYLADRGPYNREKIWHPYHQETPAYIIPPIANISDGPSGLDYYPGTGFGDSFKNTFFLCDFRGSSFNSGVRTIRNQQEGAFWKVDQQGKPIWGILATDLQFGSDGKLYVSDWVNGWYGENKGRIYAFYDPQQRQSQSVTEVERILREGVAEFSADQLHDLLGHPDRRVRQETQFELVDRGQWEGLKSAALEHSSPLGRIHAIWGLEQLIRAERSLTSVMPANPNLERDQPLWELVEKLLADDDFEIRAQATQLAVYFSDSAVPALMPLLQDDNLRVRYYASLALSNIGDPRCIQPIIDLLVENQNRDPIVRHGGILVLQHLLQQPTQAGDDLDQNDFDPSLDRLTRHPDPAVRLALVVALRKLMVQADLRDRTSVSRWEAKLAELLGDQDPNVSLEAARVVYDLPVPSLISKLAEVPVTQPTGTDRLAESHLQSALASRVIQANLRTGKEENAVRLGGLATQLESSAADRTMALSALIKWCDNFNKDPLLNDWRPRLVENRNEEIPRRVLVAHFDQLLASEPAIANLATVAAGKLKAEELQETLARLVVDTNASTSQRVSALKSLSQLGADHLASPLTELKNQVAQSKEFPTELLVELATLGAQTDEQEGLQILADIIDQANVPLAIKQQSILAIGNFSSSASMDWLMDKIQHLKISHTDPSAKLIVPDELKLDYVLAAQSRSELPLQQAAQAYLDSLQSENDPSAGYQVALNGGDYERGKRVFETKTEVSCIRCHRVDPNESAVGPYLGEIGLKRDRQHLLDSIVQPNKDISEGFGQIKIQTSDGLMQIGLLVEETDQHFKLLDAEGNYATVLKEDVEEIQPGLSSMPLDLIHSLSLAELRDLVEYLAEQKGENRNNRQ